MHAFIETVKHLKDAMMGVHNVKRDEKIICLHLKCQKRLSVTLVPFRIELQVLHNA